MKHGIFFRSLRNQKRKSHSKKRMHFQYRGYKHIFKNIKRRRFKSLGKRKPFLIKNRIKKAIKESNNCVRNNGEKIVVNSAIDSIIEKMKLVHL